MKTRIDPLRNWIFHLEEASAGVYKLKAEHVRGATIELTGADRDLLLKQAESSAAEMERELKLRLWDELERSLTSLVESMSSNLGKRDLDLLTDFIENREYGVALQWLDATVIEHSIELSPAQETEIQRLAEVCKLNWIVINIGPENWNAPGSPRRH
jgi:hypothetical protein